MHEVQPSEWRVHAVTTSRLHLERMRVEINGDDSSFADRARVSGPEKLLPMDDPIGRYLA